MPSAGLCAQAQKANLPVIAVISCGMQTMPFLRLNAVSYTPFELHKGNLLLVYSRE